MAEVVEDWRRAVTRGFFIGNGQPVMSFDVVLTESHTSELEVTDNPVETGVVMSDHAFKRPDRLEMEIGVSDVTLNTEGRFPEGDCFAGIGSRAANAWRQLKNLQESAEPFDVQTGLELYTEMLIERLTSTQDKRTAGVLKCQVSLRKVTRSTTEMVTVPPRKVGKPHRQASQKTNGGEKSTTPVTDPAKARSIAHQLGVKDGQFKNPGQFFSDLAAGKFGGGP